MLNSSIKINSKINSIQNLVYCQDWEELYKKICTIDIKYNKCKNNTCVNKPNFPYTKMELIMPQYIYRYTVPHITPDSLQLKFTELNNSEMIAILFKYYGNNNIITLENFIFFMNNIKEDTYLNMEIKTIIAGYHLFIDYNIIFNKIPKPKIALLLEYGYTDSYEKLLITNTKLEYIIETHHEITLDINELSLYLYLGI